MRVLSLILVAFFAFYEVVKCGENVHGGRWSRRHNSNVAVQQNTSLEKRFDGVKFTYYAAGLGACGKYNVASDFIVALNAAQFDGGAHCFQTITITVNGKSAQATIMDECMGCPYGGLDLTSGLFSFLGSEALGVLSGSWVFGGEASPSPTPKPTPKSTSTYQPPPSSTSSVIHYTTSNTTSIQSSTSSPTSTQSSASVSSTPTPLIPPQEAGNIADLFLMFVEVESILTVGHLG